jgi:DNA polymerase-3 subunit gamma/tau
MLAGNLEKVESVAISGPKSLVLRFPERYNLHQEHCQEPARLSRVAEALRRLTGQDWIVRVDSASSEAAALQPSAAEPDSSPSRYRRQRTEALQVPLVKRALEVLGAQFVQLDEGFGAAPVECATTAETQET